MDSLDAFGKGAYNEHLIHVAQQKKIPISGTFELLPNCNMHCRMCYIQHTVPHQRLQPVSFWVELFRKSIEAGMLFPLLTGGEPLLYPGFFELYEELASMPVFLCINTNATLLGREAVERLAKNPPRRLNISLYGASNETYERLCGNPAGFDQVTRAFELLKEYGIPFRVHSTLVPENLADYDGMIEVCNRYEAPLAMATYMFPPHRRDEEGVAKDRLAPGKMARAALRYQRDASKHQMEDYRRSIALMCAGIEHPEIYSLYGRNEPACRAGKCTFWVDWRGTMSACGVHHQKAVDLHQVPFKQAWEQILGETEKVRLSEKCRNCRYRCVCPTCPAAAFCESGAEQGVPEYLCRYCEEYARLLFEERKRLFGE